MAGANIPLAANQPASSDQASSEPASTELASTEPASTDPASTEPASTEPASTEPASTEPASTEPASTEPASTEPAKRGRPRSEAADRAILLAATELLAERGLAGTSIEEVAARAGVGKATIYRRWSSRGVLALDAFLAEFSGLQPLPDTGSLRSDLLAALTGWVHAVTRTRAGAVLAGLIAEAQRDPALAVAWRDRVLGPLRAQQLIMLERAIQRGDLPVDIDTDVILDMMFGAAYHRLLHRHRPLNDKFVHDVVNLITAAISSAEDGGAEDCGEKD
jgi:AcrR family transcriptional regulator